MSRVQFADEPQIQEFDSRQPVSQMMQQQGTACTVCDKVYKTERGMKIHRTKTHGSEYKSTRAKKSQPKPQAQQPQVQQPQAQQPQAQAYRTITADQLQNIQSNIYTSLSSPGNDVTADIIKAITIFSLIKSNVSFVVQSGRPQIHILKDKPYNKQQVLEAYRSVEDILKDIQVSKPYEQLAPASRSKITKTQYDDKNNKHRQNAINKIIDLLRPYLNETISTVQQHLEDQHEAPNVLNQASYYGREVIRKSKSSQHGSTQAVDFKFDSGMKDKLKKTYQNTKLKHGAIVQVIDNVSQKIMSNPAVKQQYEELLAKYNANKKIPSKMILDFVMKHQ